MNRVWLVLPDPFSSRLFFDTGIVSRLSERLGDRLELLDRAEDRLLQVKHGTEPSRLAVSRRRYGEAMSGEWERPERVEEYLGRTIPHRHLAESTLVAALPSRVERCADLGCGEGTLSGDLLRDNGFTQVIAADVSARALAQAARRLRLDRMPDARRERLTMFQSSLTYRDARLAGLDAAVVEVLHPHQEAGARGAREQPGQQRGPQVPDVERSRRAGREASPQNGSESATSASSGAVASRSE